MPHAIATTDATFVQEILGAPTLALVDFWAPWCGPCQFMGPVIDQLATSQADTITVAKLNVDENQETARSYNVRSIPTLILFRDGEEVARHVGAMPAAQLHGWLTTHGAEATSGR